MCVCVCVCVFEYVLEMERQFFSLSNSYRRESYLAFN